jgi:ABC-type multidrug transport system fused ATPase/permease subunit
LETRLLLACALGAVLLLGGIVALAILVDGAWMIAGFVVLIGGLFASALFWEGRRALRSSMVELAKLRERKRIYLSEGLADLTDARRRYRDEISSFIEEYRADANHNRRTANNLQSIIILGSLITTSATSAVGQAWWIRWTAVLLSLLVAGSAGIAGFFKFRERAMNQRQTADAIEHEYNAAELGIKRYKGMERDQALAELAETVELLREEQRKREQQLEQPVETRHVTNQHPGVVTG